MIERRSNFFIEDLFLLFFYIIFICLPITELLPQHNEQFPSGPAPLYNVPEYTTQFKIIPDDRGQQIPLNDNTRVLNNFNNFNTNEGDISSALPIDDNHRPRGQKSYFSGLSEELESVGIEDQNGEGIPGEAQQDYPVYEEIPRTGFSCRGRHAPAYYADVEARCQVFHICDVGGHKHSFLCPNGSVFNQKYLVCDWWYDFTCDNAENLFNKQIVPTEINSVSPSIPLLPNSIESDKILLNGNNNEGFQSQNSPNDYNIYQHNNNDGFIYNQEENRNAFNHPNTQIDIPQQIYTDNVYIPQNDIFHGAETGFPGRDLISESIGNLSKNIINNNNQNNNNTVNENSNKNNSENQESNYNLQQNKFNEQNNDKQLTKINDEGSIQPNANDNGIRKQLRSNRKGNDFSPQNRNKVIENNSNNNNKEQVNFQNINEEEVNLNKQGDQRNILNINNNNNNNNNNNLNNQHLNFQTPYNNGKFQQNHLQGNENYDGNKSPIHPSIQPQLNFAPPKLN